MTMARVPKEVAGILDRLGSSPGFWQDRLEKLRDRSRIFGTVFATKRSEIDRMAESVASKTQQPERLQRLTCTKSRIARPLFPVGNQFTVPVLASSILLSSSGRSRNALILSSVSSASPERAGSVVEVHDLSSLSLSFRRRGHDRRLLTNNAR